MENCRANAAERMPSDSPVQPLNISRTALPRSKPAKIQRMIHIGRRFFRRKCRKPRGGYIHGRELFQCIFCLVAQPERLVRPSQTDEQDTSKKDTKKQDHMYF